MREWTPQQAIANGGDRARQIIDLLLGRELRVTKAMIREGYKNDCHRCPVALAVCDAVPGFDIYVDYWLIEIDSCVRFVVPDKAEDFMQRFDRTSNRERLSGFRFTLTELQMFFCGPKAARALPSPDLAGEGGR